MKKIIILAIIAIIWLSWGGFSNEMGTLMMSLSAVFLLTKNGNCAKGEEEKK